MPYGKPVESVRRFSLIKWSVAGVLLALLLFTWLTGTNPPENASGLGKDAGTGSTARSGAPASAAPGSAGSAGSAGSGGFAGATGVAAVIGSPGPPSLMLDRAADGTFRVQGVVADEATRNRWLNEIRIGAQGARVTDELKVGTVSPAAERWTGHLGGLVALMRERGLAGLRVDGATVRLSGHVVSAAEKGDTEKMVQAQLPADFRLDSQLAIGSPPPGAPRAAVAESAASGTVPPAQKEGGSTVAGQTERREADRLAQRDATRQTGEARKSAEARPTAEADARKPARTPADCPRQLRTLAQPVYFKTDSVGIAAEDRARLQRLAQCLGRARLRIVGHSDPRLSEAYNQELSEHRARAVADVLTESGVASTRISVVGAGKSRPASKGDSRQELQRSRRVDIQIG